MVLVSWKFYEGFSNYKREMDRLFERFFYDEMTEETFDRTWAPSINISESNTEILVTAELTGIRIEDIQIILKDNFLTIQGERKFDKREKPEIFCNGGGNFDAFVRKVRLPSGIDTDNISSYFKNGVLTIKIPKLRPVTIKIEVT
ncbi:MAG: Hsp20/alpha crystallin family protein [Thermodesulfobacteriota bacterium]|nr:Hsp20/alpha crystallin family protein [Thermodesulfobacteriota bacterium]